MEAIPDDWGFSDAPDGVKSIVTKSIASMKDDSNLWTARRCAILNVRLAGWYKTKEGWKKLIDDLRSKVSVEPAIRQPDGAYLVENVELFYPNAVHGGPPNKDYPEGQPITLTPDDIEEIVRNTNELIASGRAQPALTQGHPTKVRIGAEPPAVGRVVNIRVVKKEDSNEAPRIFGDLIQVSPEVVRDMEADGYMSVSAVIGWDKGALNKRITQVALMGQSSPALTHLKRTSVYVENAAVSEPEAVFCYSVGQCSFSDSTGVSTMEKKDRHAELAKHYAAMSAAHSCASANEPEHEKKLKAAYESYQSFAAAIEKEDEDDKKKSEYAAGLGRGDVTDNGKVNPEEDGKPEFPYGKGPNADKKNKMGGHSGSVIPEYAALQREVGELKAAFSQMLNDRKIAEFSARVQSAVAGGAQFDASAMIDMVKSADDVDKAIFSCNKLLASMTGGGQAAYSAPTNGGVSPNPQDRAGTIKSDILATAMFAGPSQQGFSTPVRDDKPNGFVLQNGRGSSIVVNPTDPKSQAEWAQAAGLAGFSSDFSAKADEEFKKLGLA